MTFYWCERCHREHFEWCGLPSTDCRRYEPYRSGDRMTEAELKRENRKLHKHLKDLTGAVVDYLDRIDQVMKAPSTPERGREIARLSNLLEGANDRARFFGLGVDWRKEKRPRPTGEVAPASEQEG